jgi:hypothetical protein
VLLDTSLFELFKKESALKHACNIRCSMDALESIEQRERDPKILSDFVVVSHF